jgi:hypothetical protein
MKHQIFLPAFASYVSRLATTTPKENKQDWKCSRNGPTAAKHVSDEGFQVDAKTRPFSRRRAKFEVRFANSSGEVSQCRSVGLANPEAMGRNETSFAFKSLVFLRATAMVTLSTPQPE